MTKTTIATLLASLALTAAGTSWAQTAFEARTDAGTAASMPLIDERLHVAIDGQYAHATLRQTYDNRSGQRVEGRYVLQAGDGARVRGFAYWNGEQKIVGEVFEKETARQVYEEVTGLGRDPGLLEQLGEGSFSFRVFPIEASEHKRIEVEVGKWLPRADGVVEYRVPLGLAGANIDVDLRDERGFSPPTSPTHRLTITKQGDGQVHVRASAPKPGAKEFVLRYAPRRKPWQLTSYVHKDDGHDGYLAITVAPPAGMGAGKATAKDVTIVLDHSGSMSGAPLEHAKLAAKAVVSRLAAHDRINVVLFDDGVDNLYPKPKLASPEVRAEALSYIDNVSDAGGTDIAKALRHTLAAQLDDDQPNVILFLTDGQSSSQEAIAAAKSDTGDARLFTIGVGSGVEKPLLSRLAKEKRGRFTYIESPEAIGARMTTLYQQIESPIMVDVAVDIEGVRVQRRYPQTVPDIYRGDELRLVGRVQGSGIARISVRGISDGKPVELRSSARIAPERRPWVGRVWAEARVDDVLEEQALRGENEELKNEVINLAVAYNFVTPYTSFLAIPADELTDGAKATLDSARDRKAKILAAHKDAAALSRTAMPPGDPILSVKAPADAVQVTAYFPFGLTKDLVYDAASEQWKTRFLVPKSVVDGTYEVKIVIVQADGQVELAKTQYTIDSTGPSIKVTTHATSGGIEIEVKSTEALRSGTLMTATGERVDLTLDPTGLVLRGRVELSSGTHALTLVVADSARNETEERVEVVVQ